MKILVGISFLLGLLCFVTCTARAQQLSSTSELKDQIQKLELIDKNMTSSLETKKLNREFLVERRKQLSFLLQKRIDALREYQIKVATIITAKENSILEDSIKNLEKEIDALKRDIADTSASTTARETLSAVPGISVSDTLREVEADLTPDQPIDTALTTEARSSSSPLPVPRFLLSHPESGRTDLPTGEFKLSWTRATWAQSYTVELSEEKDFSTTVTLANPVVTGKTNFTVEKEALKPGKTYYWRVIAECNPSLATCPPGNRVVAANAPYSFSTVREIAFFQDLEKKGFSLQRVVSGDDETEGASFSFLKTFKQKTVYAADFALLWDSTAKKAGTSTQYWVETTVEGHLTSDESAAEDAWRFGVSAVLYSGFDVENLRGGLKGLYSYLGGKLETDQGFNTKKLYFEALETPTLTKFLIGKYSGTPASALQFRWRPFFGFNAGHTFKRGEAVLPENNILRFVPRLRAEVRLNFISQALKIPRSLIFADNTFYYLPLERTMKTSNFFASGLELDFTRNIGIAFDYKNGNAAPKFQRVHTLGGALTIRFGKNAQ